MRGSARPCPRVPGRVRSLWSVRSCTAVRCGRRRAQPRSAAAGPAPPADRPRPGPSPRRGGLARTARRPAAPGLRPAAPYFLPGGRGPSGRPASWRAWPVGWPAASRRAGGARRAGLSPSASTAGSAGPSLGLRPAAPRLLLCRRGSSGRPAALRAWPVELPAASRWRAWPAGTACRRPARCPRRVAARPSRAVGPAPGRPPRGDAARPAPPGPPPRADARGGRRR